jgi:hypothetical protein
MANMAFDTPEHVQISTIKMREWEKSDTIIIRVAEIAGIAIERAILTIPLVLASRIDRVEEMDLLERGLGSPNRYIEGKRELVLDMVPFEVKTFGFHLNEKV